MDDKYLESSGLPYYFPEVMRENPDYKVLIDLASLSFGRLESEIDDFNSLIDPDTCPVMFLPLLGTLLGYNYRYDIKPEFNREIIKNILSVYAMRGTDRALIMAATYGDCPGYIGGNIFVPGTKPDRVEAYLEFPRDQIFRHTISNYSGPDKRADDNLFREGIIEIVLERFNDQIRDRAESVKPAGYVLRFKHLVWIQPTGSNHVMLNTEIFLDIMFMVNSRIFKTNSLWSRGGARSEEFRYSGDRFYNVDILRMIDLNQVDGRRYFMTYDNPVWMYYQPSSDQFDKPTDLQLPVETKQSSPDYCVTDCIVIYGHTENSSYEDIHNVRTIEDFSRKYVVTEVDVSIFRGPEPPEPPEPDDPDTPVVPDPDNPDVPDVPVEPDEPTDTSKSHLWSGHGLRSHDFTYGGNPDEPEEPSVPDEPEEPDVPEEPSKPGVKGDSLWSNGGARSDDLKYGGNPDED